MKDKRDSKDPLPSAANSERIPPDGNSPAGEEKLGQAKAEYVKEDQRFDLRTGGETQPTRQGGDGNVPATGEAHGQKKAERVSADSRF